MRSGKQLKSKGKGRGIMLVLIFLTGLAVFLYPTLSNRYYMWQYEREVAAWEAAREKADYSALWEAAESYNQTLALTQNLYAAVSDEEAQYVSTLLNPLENGMMGYIDIEAISVHLPIYQGTEEKQLQSGAGWWIGTSLPTGGENTHCVITAHTGLVKAKMFTDIDQLAEGDTFTLTILDRVMTYEVDQILVTEPDDLDPLAIVPGEDYVTLYTCTPYGVNTHRLLVRGHRIETPEEQEQETEELSILWILIPAFLLLVAFILVIRKRTRYHRRYERRKRK